MVKGYAGLATLSTFTIDDATAFTGNMNTASSLVHRLVKRGLVAKIRNNLYTCINVVDGQPVVSKYQIGCAITEDAYISHHRAFSFPGVDRTGVLRGIRLFDSTIQ